MPAITRQDHAALFAILSSLADNKQALGRRYAFWCNGAPALESAVAAAAMTQDELGHARTLYPLLNNFVQAEAAPQQIEPETRDLRYWLAELDHDFQGWSDFVATNFLCDAVFTVFFEAAQQSSYEPLRQRARKIVQEEQLHGMHAEGWIKRLAQAGGAVRGALNESLTRYWDEALCWFGPDDDPNIFQLYQDGMIDCSPTELRQRYLARVMPVLQSQDLDLPARFDPAAKTWELTQVLPWSTWNLESRRIEVGA